MNEPQLPRGVSDSHFHSTAMADRGLDPNAILRELRAAGAGTMLDVAITPDDVERQRELTGGIDDVYYTVGLHPGSTGRDDWAALMDRVTEELAVTSESSSGASSDAIATADASVSGRQTPRRRRYHAVGETGLDWYRMYAPRERQELLFRRHLELADAVSLPVIVHNRDADEDCLRLLTDVAPSAGGVMHCYSSGPEWVDRFVDAGMYISFAGNVTFKNAGPLREACVRVPAERLLVETDAPFLAPHPHRGRSNDPRMLRYTIAVIAEVLGVPPQEVAETTRVNLRRMLRLDE